MVITKLKIMNKKIAIVCLSKSYNDLNEYSELISRNLSIIKYIGTGIPVLIFNEGDISLDHQDYIKNLTPELKIEFIDISSVWINEYSYSSMCRFFSYHVWNYCKEYDYVLRIDTDCELTFSDKFLSIVNDNNIFYKSMFWSDSHPTTNQTLPYVIESLTGKSKGQFWYNFPYTNVYFSQVKFWLSNPVNKILKKICLSNDQLIYRWGDLPILGSLLNIFAEDRIGTLPIKYKHNSHSLVVDCINQQAINYDGSVRPSYKIK